MKVAAYQAPLLPCGSIETTLRLIRERVDWCESQGVGILGCPEGILGGLADYANRPAEFTVGELTFGILICRDSTYCEPASIMASQGARALFVPTNNGLPPGTGPELVAEARNGDIARAIENRVSVIRADVAGRAESLTSFGSTGIVDSDGTVLQSARPLSPDLIVADVETAPRAHQRGWDVSRNRAVLGEYIRFSRPPRARNLTWRDR